jgi:hypothetical protein
MAKIYHKLSDIISDIKVYESKLRHVVFSTKEYNEIKQYINSLKALRKKLIKQNAGNAAFFHKGIPPIRKFSKKQQVLDALYKEKHEMLLRHDRELYELDSKIKLTKQSKDYVKRGSI